MNFMQERKPNFIPSIVFGAILLGLAIYLIYLASTSHNELALVLAVPGLVLAIISLVFSFCSLRDSFRVLRIKEKSYSNLPVIINLIITFLLLLTFIIVPLYDTIYRTIKQYQWNAMIKSDQNEVHKNQQKVCLHPENYPRTLYLEFCQNAQQGK